MRGYQYDVVVAGGGAAGVAAAVGARKAGARTLLVERNPYLGGEATHSGVAACGFYNMRQQPCEGSRRSWRAGFKGNGESGANPGLYRISDRQQEY